MIREQFFKDPDGAQSYRKDKVFLQRVWRYIEGFERETGRSLDTCLTREDYIRLFSSMNIQRTSSFPGYKGAVVYYVEYLIAHGVLPESQLSVLTGVSAEDLDSRVGERTIYFKNLPDLKQKIDETVNVAITNHSCIDQHRFDIASAILYLAWYGLSEEEILNLRKDQVSMTGVSLKGRQIEMDPDVVKHLIELCQSSGYRVYLRGEVFKPYHDSVYLIRSDRSEQLNLNGLRNSLARMNRIQNGVSSLKYDTAYYSGIFFRAYMQECNSVDFPLDDLEFASKVFCEPIKTYAKLQDRKNDYKLYKQKFS